MGKDQKSVARAVNAEEWDEEAREQARLLKAFFGTGKQYFGGFNQLFKGISDPRNPDLIVYPLVGLLFTGVWMFACQLGSRRQIQAKLRGNSRSEAKFEALFGVERIPHGDTELWLQAAGTRGNARSGVWHDRGADPQESAVSMAAAEVLLSGGYGWHRHAELWGATL